MHSGDIFSYAESVQGQQLRDTGIAQALSNSDDWGDLALIELEQIWKSRRYEQNEFTFEMLKFPVVATIGQPHTPNCWGGLAQKMVKRNWIICTGTDTAKNASGHCSLRRKYRWL